MKKDLHTLLRELKVGLAGTYGARLHGVYLYGSYARGTHDAESDFDVLVVLDDFASYGNEVDRTSEFVAALSLRYAVSISIVFVRKQQWGNSDSPFLRHVRDEATETFPACETGF